MKVKVYTLKKGLEEFFDVVAIRIKSKDYNLLILKDYLSIIGEINGNFEIETMDKKVEYKEIKAYYMNHKNIFNVIIEGE